MLHLALIIYISLVIIVGGWWFAQGSTGSEFAPIAIIFGLITGFVSLAVLDFVLVFTFWIIRTKSRTTKYIYFIVLITIIAATPLLVIQNSQRNKKAAEQSINKISIEDASDKIKNCKINTIHYDKSENKIWISNNNYAGPENERVVINEPSVKSEYEKLVKLAKTQDKCGDVVVYDDVNDNSVIIRPR